MGVQTENNKRARSQGTLPGSQHFEGGKGGMLELRDGTRKSDKHQLFTQIYTKPTQGG